MWSCFLDGRLSLPFPRPFRLAGWGITVLLFYYYGRKSTSGGGCRLEDYKNAIIIIYVVFYEKGWKGWARAQGPAKYTPWYPRIQTLAVLNQLFRLWYETSSGMKQALVWNKIWYETRSGMKQAHEHQRSSASSKLSPTWLIPNSLRREKSKIWNLKVVSVPRRCTSKLLAGRKGALCRKPVRL